MQFAICRRTLIQSLGAVSTASLLGAHNVALALDDKGTLAGLQPPRKDWLPTKSQAIEWHKYKVSKGPALTGNPSWHSFLEFLEGHLKSLGCVDVHRSPWTFDRMETSMWPDKSKWGLTIGGKSVEVANFGANCGITGPEGTTAEMVLWDPDEKPDVTGKIVVYRPVPRADVRDAFSNSDYEVMTPYDSWPIEGKPVTQAPGGTHSISSVVWDDMTASSQFVEQMRELKPAGVIFAMNLNRAATEGLYTFGVPRFYDFPSVYVNKTVGDRVIAEVSAGRKATIRVEGARVPSQAYQLIAYLPGRNYGTAEDRQVWLRTHTDGPSISQDDGALGLLGVVQYVSHIHRAERPRSLMIELDCRHFMPGMERNWTQQDYFEKNPNARDKIIAEIAMEHLGQIEYVFYGEDIKPSGRSLATWVYSTGNDGMIQAALNASRDNSVRSTVIRSPGRPGVHGGDQGPWYGMGRAAQYLGIPGYGVQGDLGAYWAHSAGMNRFDARSFCRQVGMFSELAVFLMAADLSALQAPKLEPK